MNNADITATKLSIGLSFEFLGQVHEQIIEVPVRYDIINKNQIRPRQFLGVKPWKSFEQKALDNFGSLIINKSFARKAGFGSRAIPVYVREWIVAHYVGEST